MNVPRLSAHADSNDKGRVHLEHQPAYGPQPQMRVTNRASAYGSRRAGCGRCTVGTVGPNVA